MRRTAIALLFAFLGFVIAFALSLPQAHAGIRSAPLPAEAPIAAGPSAPAPAETPILAPAR